MDANARYVSVKTLSQMIDTPERTIRDWILKRKIRFIKIGRSVRISTSQFGQDQNQAESTPLMAIQVVQ